MGTTTMKTRTRVARWLFGMLAGGFTLLGLTGHAQAQEIPLTGPLAGAPAVRELRLYRQGRFEVSPAISFSLLDEYERTIFAGARLNYNLTDWLALGVYGAYGVIKYPTALADHVQDVNVVRRRVYNKPSGCGPAESCDQLLTAVNMGPKFQDQIGTMDWVLAPQLTVAPFRGKLALFDSVFVDTDLYVFAGPAFVGVSERGDCTAGHCTADASFDRKSRVAVTATFGLGLTFYINKWNAIGLEWRGLPFSRNTGGFDTRGSGPNGNFPDHAISSADQQFQFNQMLTLSYNFYFPMQYRISE
jgi:outer membrane beta-barrel protein